MQTWLMAGQVLARTHSTTHLGGASAVVAAVVAVVAVGGIAFYSIRKSRRRRAELAPFNDQQLAWQQGPDDQNLMERYSRRQSGFLGLLDRATSGNRFDHRVYQVLHATHRGYRAVAFEYAYTEEHRQANGYLHRRDHFVCVVSLDLPAARPNLLVSRETSISRMRRDVQLGNAEFDKAFRVSGDNERFTHDVLPQPTMQWLLADPRSQYFPIKFEGATLTTWQDGHLDAASLTPMTDYLAELLARVPAFVWDAG